ncbi:MAG: hypothetical protein Q9166_002729 [cf. Caloplaca sp. 2 TL-2023]
MTEDLLLTELCMICGIRDPTTYLKRSDLATPKGIDHDYNYLTSVERQLDNAERNAQSGGILLYNGDQRKRLHQPAKGEVPLENAIKQCRIVVDRAPKGMSRQKQNETHWDRRAKRIIWTVEWVHKNGNREIGRCPDTEPLNAAYTKLVTPKALTKAEEVASLERPPKKKRKQNRPASKPAFVAPIIPPKDMPSRESPTSATVPQQSSTDQEVTTALMQDSSQQEPPLPSPKVEQPAPPQLHFYLLLPSTPTSYRVLIPLAPHETLTTALTDRLVLEFPTIYALKQPPDKLPTGFMTEEQYLRNVAEKARVDRRLDGLLNEAPGWGKHQLGRDGERDLDPGALQDVLKKDLISVVDAV